MKKKKEQDEKSRKRYIETFCKERRIRRRFAVYVSGTTHDFLKQAAGIFKSKYYTTVSSMADAILRHHFESHAGLLERFKEGNRNRQSESGSEIKTDETMKCREESGREPNNESADMHGNGFKQ